MKKQRLLKLPVLEIFGPTFQGEGRAIGQKTMFVRTGGCDYHCDWCDSAFTWDGSEKPTMMTSDQIIEALDKLGTYDYVTLSGGNPCLLAANMAQLVRKLKKRQVTLAVETQGSRWQEWLKAIDQVTLSPKPPSSKMKVKLQTLDFIVSNLDPQKVTYKIPIFDEDDLKFAQMIQGRYQPDVLYLSVGNPEPKASGDIVQNQLKRLKELWEHIAQDDSWGNVRVLPQLHTLVYDNKRGV
ncbi:7-carboxy-7-deazaguanine synthase QueE [Streptococcus mutans]|uniref:7-carboxy-7-deazaguanine synthase QueE n=1 Tax=Streptococcus mutans TaxID=1309 RepID=UPI002740C58B|nr:7-carboxy-7-deazaguanine synthase QueE [Streptococcus mutans]MDP5885908.1 7-carboxy-7-deazaguanine synthase QueE [Streptococcus mutans]MDW5546748.1 7-carboxy-7-deazaguanine synthase QueE [Streptococcus mutans]